MSLVLLLGSALVGPGCPYVSRAEIEAQLELRDDDGDGVSVADGDCNDLDSTVFPGADEVPYDNVDNDCLDGDLRDVDADGHDGCLLEGGSCVEGVAPDCDDADPERFPGAQDEPYDGVDSDCRGDHDFDLDSDGFAAASADEDALSAYEASSGLSAERGDCLDTNLTVYPGAPGDTPYDGVDTDCDGVNDFDADGDGFVAPEDDSALALAALERYLEEIGEAIPSDDELDCDDADDAVNPAADEVWYDGIDTDCDGADDYDQDGDGFPQDEDCSDDPTVDADAPLRSPATIEGLSTAADDDCFSGGDSRWGGADTVWLNPRSVRLATVDDRFVLGAVLDGYESPFASIADDTLAVALLNFDVLGAPAPSTDERLFLFPPNAIDAVSISAAGTDLDFGWVEPFESTLVSRLYRYGLTGVGPGQGLAGPTVALSTGVLEAEVIDLQGDWTWACGGDQLLAVEDADSIVTASTTLPSEALTCFQEATPGEATVCLDVGCQTFQAEEGVLTAVPGRAGARITEALRIGDVWTFIDDGLLVVEGASVPSEAADHAAFAADGGDVVGLLQGPGGLELLHGPDGGPFERIAVDPGVDGAVVEVAVSMSELRVFAAVRTDADEVRWAAWAR